MPVIHTLADPNLGPQLRPLLTADITPADRDRARSNEGEGAPSAAAAPPVNDEGEQAAELARARTWSRAVVAMVVVAAAAGFVALAALLVAVRVSARDHRWTPPPFTAAGGAGESQALLTSTE